MYGEVIGIIKISLLMFIKIESVKQLLIMFNSETNANLGLDQRIFSSIFCESWWMQIYMTAKCSENKESLNVQV